MNFYALYSGSQESYSTPFLAHDDKEAISIVSKTVVANQDPTLIMSLDDLTIVKVGSFESGCPVPVGVSVPIDVLGALHQTLPLPPMIKSQVDKLYAKKEVSDAQ